MRIACVSDLHGHFREVAVPACDVLIIAGDVAKNHGSFDAEQLAKWARAQSCNRILFVPGNHDSVFFDKPTTPSMLGIVQLFDSGCTIDGFKFWGFPWSLNLRNNGEQRAGEQRVSDLDLGVYQERCRKIPDDVDVLVSHARVRLDLLAPRRRFRLHIFGHEAPKNMRTPWSIDPESTSWIFASLARSFQGDRKTVRRRAVVATITIAEFDSAKRLVKITREPALEPSRQSRMTITVDHVSEPVVGLSDPEGDFWLSADYEREENTGSSYLHRQEADTLADVEPELRFLLPQYHGGTRRNLPEHVAALAISQLAAAAAKRAGLPLGTWLRLKLPEWALTELARETRDPAPLP